MKIGEGFLDLGFGEITEVEDIGNSDEVKFGLRFGFEDVKMFESESCFLGGWVCEIKLDEVFEVVVFFGFWSPGVEKEAWKFDGDNLEV